MNTDQWQMLLEAFGDAASHAYQAAAQQTTLNALGAATSILIVLFVGVLLIHAYKQAKNKELDKEVVVIVFFFIGVIYSLLSLVILASSVSILGTYIFNRDWAILRTLSTLIR